MAGRHRLNGRRVIIKRRGLEMVDSRTLVAHMLSDAAAVAGRRGGGRYFALCGAEVIPASLTAAPEGGYCRSCTVIPTPEDDAVTGAPNLPVVPDAPARDVARGQMGCGCIWRRSAE